MRRSPNLLDPLKLPGALAGGVRSHFDSVAHEPLPAKFMELLRKMDAESDTGEDRGTWTRGGQGRSH
jgi:hypothetical protein